MAHRPDDQPERVTAFESALGIWSRRKWLALFVFSAVCAAFVSVAVSLPNLYRATATVLVESQEVSEAFVRSSVTAQLETRIQTIRQEIMSRARLTDLINRMGLYSALRERMTVDALVERMRRDIQLDLKGVQQTSGHTATIAFAVSYRGEDPQKAAEVANTLASFYVGENIKIRERQAARTADFLKTQLADVKTERDRQEGRVSDFKLSHIGELPQQVGANLAALERLNMQLRLNSEQQIRALDRRERLTRQLAAADSAEPAAAPVSTPALQLAKLKRELADLRNQFTDEFPDVIRAKAEIAALERELAQVAAQATATTPPADPAASLRQDLGDVDGELASQKEEERFLRQAIAAYEQRVENAPKWQEEFQELSRDYETTKERYDTLLKRYEEAELAQSLEQDKKVEQFRILDPAIPPMDPTAPNRLQLILMGLILSIGLAFGAAVAAEKFDTSFHTLEDLRAFVNVRPVISIPRILTKTDRRRRRWRVALVTASALVVLTLIVAGSHYMADGNDEIVRLVARGA